MNKETIRCAALSDLHGYLPDNIQECDLVLIPGDIVPLNIQRNFDKSLEWFKNTFIPWCMNLPCDKVVFCPGNHDFFLEKFSESEITRLIWELNAHMKVVCLHDSIVHLWVKDNNVKIYGTGWCIGLSNWAFYTPDESEYSNIPECDILITHQPPMLGSIGMVHQQGWNYMRSFCSYKLAEAMVDKGIKWALCGHVHSGNHVPEKIQDIWINNVSLLDEDYKVNYDIFYFELNLKNEDNV